MAGLTDAVLFEMVEPHIALVTLNRPEARNAVNGAVAEAMEAIVDRIELDDEIRVAVLTGASGWHMTEAPLAVSISAEIAPPCRTPVAGSPTSRAS